MECNAKIASRRTYGVADWVKTLDPTTILAIAIASGFIYVLLGTIHFPLGTHADEVAKVDSILKGHNPSYHPILMAQVVRAANGLAGFVTPQAIVELGRSCAVVAGGIAVFASFLLAREVLPPPAALSATLALAVVPIVTVHARYFKEDIFMLPLIICALVALIKALRCPTTTRGVLLGVAIGGAAAAKYVAAIVLPFALIILLLNPWEAADRRARIRFAGLVTIVAGAVFTLIELPVFRELAQFRHAVLFELGHAAHGHDVRLPITVTHGAFHLRESLMPGLGLPLLALGILGLAASWWGASERRQPLLIISAFTLLWYLGHEISPLKPYPGFARYMLPVAPLLIILGAALVQELTYRYAPVMIRQWASGFIIIVAAVPAFAMSLLVNGPSREDLRSSLPPIILTAEKQTAFDSYTQFMGLGRRAFLQSLPTETTAKLLVTSNFAYDRYTEFGYSLDQRKRTRTAANYYNRLFQFPYLEVTNGRPSYGFFNPVIRIVALDANADHLAPVASALQRSTLALTVQLVNAD